MALDDAKIAAVTKCSNCDPLTIIHGPPGTGKTTTLAAAILSAVVNGDKVLAVAPSHAAVDALILAITSQWPSQILEEPTKGKIIRLGTDLRLTVDRLKVYLPSNQSAENDPRLSDIIYRLTCVRRDLLTTGKGKGELLEEERRLIKEMKSINFNLESRKIENAKIVVCTNLTAQTHQAIQEKLNNQMFNLVCIDEAAFASDYNTLPIALKASRLILSGDHLQLPPVILSEECRKSKEYSQSSLMERLAKDLPESVQLLNVQYRSNRLISDWSSKYFYENSLLAHSSVANNLLTDLPNTIDSQETQSSLFFIDTSGCNYHEDTDSFFTSSDEIEESIANYDEAFLIENIVERYLSLGVKPHDIGVIAPYWAQVAVLRSLIWTNPKNRKIEIRTVDGYQGREKELVVISFVRSNPQRHVGFLSETRRINVSVTRAKKCLVAVGDASTLTSDKGINSFIKYCREKKAVKMALSILK